MALFFKQAAVPIATLSQDYTEKTANTVEDDAQIREAIRLFEQGEPHACDVTSCDGDVTVLSSNGRGITIASWNNKAQKKTIVRVTPCEAFPKISKASDISAAGQSSSRILLFGQTVINTENIPGLVPVLTPPKLYSQQYMVEQYEEILNPSLGNIRVDFHQYINGHCDPTKTRQALMYLYDVLIGIVELHDRGWAHLDVSFENVVLSDEHAYLIDFESVLPFHTMPDGCLQRRQLGVPIKGSFVPPEHFAANTHDLLPLRTYDVWAFGVMFFAILFGRYLFDVHKEARCLFPDEKQVSYFLQNGFESFLKQYHREQRRILFRPAKLGLSETYETYFRLAGDLLSSILKRPRAIPVVDHVAHFDGCTECPVFFSDCDRATARDVLGHPFWGVCGIGDGK